jgi:16S rRNA (cytosine967-C5)-methyltransferase
VVGQKPREIAAQVLNQALAQDPLVTRSEAKVRAAIPAKSDVLAAGETRNRAFVDKLLETSLASAQLMPVDRRLCQELVLGVVRWSATLDWLIKQRVTQQFPALRLRNLLRLGLYQIFWLDRIPAHAAVHETVELAKRSGFGAQTGFVNALLRGYLREYEVTKARLAELKVSDPPLGFSHPEWLASRWRKQWDEQSVAKLMEWNNTPPKTFARVNLLKVQPGDLLKLWRDEGVEYDFIRSDWFDENLVFELKSHPPLRNLGSFQRGFFYVQDPGTLLAVHILNPQPGETILDLCAAPGGKLTYIAQCMANEGRMVAYDLSPERRELIKENCVRLGVTCAEIVLELPIPSGQDRFDRILIDAPCSNTGVMRRRVDLRWRIREEEIQRLRTIQLDLLRQAVPLLKPRGTLVYSTCSLEPEENHEVIAQFLRESNELQIEEERQLLPFREQVDGAYVVRLK